MLLPSVSGEPSIPATILSTESSISKQIDESVRVMVKDCYKQTYSIISKNREAMDKLVDLLIEKETLDGEEFVQILSEFTQIPEKQRTPQILN